MYGVEMLGRDLPINLFSLNGIVRPLMKRMRVIVSLFGLACAAGMVAALSPVAAEPYKIKLATHWPVLHDMNNVMIEFARDIGRESAGRIEVTYYPAGTLAASGEKFQKLRTGVCDVANIHLANHPGVFPLAQLTTLPFLFADGTEAAWVLNRMRDAFEKSLEANNVKLLFMVGDPNFQILLKSKKINVIDDFKGLRLKCGGFADETLKAWGAVPVQLKHGDMYLAMQRGVVDGIVFPLGAAKSFKLEEVTKYVFKTDFFSYHLFMGMNLDTWNGLPKELQEAVMRASNKAAYLSGFHYQNTDGGALQAYVDKGVEVYEPSPAVLAKLKASTSAIRERLILSLEKDGLPAADTLGRIEGLMAEYRRWTRPTVLKPVYK